MKTKYLKWASTVKEMEALLAKGWRIATHQEDHYSILMEYNGEELPE
jgi:hypothetical protein